MYRSFAQPTFSRLEIVTAHWIPVTIQSRSGSKWLLPSDQKQLILDDIEEKVFLTVYHQSLPVKWLNTTSGFRTYKFSCMFLYSCYITMLRLFIPSCTRSWCPSASSSCPDAQGLKSKKLTSESPLQIPACNHISPQHVQTKEQT